MNFKDIKYLPIMLLLKVLSKIPVIKKYVKRYVVIAVIVLMVSGCCSMGQQAIYADGEHFFFSAHGYKNATIYDAYKAAYFEWWGCTVYVR